jgi:hypothetical protein
VTGADLERLFYRNLPREFVRKVLQNVYLAHQVAWDECYSRFAPTEAKNLLGYERRGKLEGYLRDAAALFDGLEARVVRAEGSNWNHTEVWGGPVVLTENSVQTPCALVQKVEFRRTLAKSNQTSLLPEPTIPDDAPLYALLLHSRWRSLDPDEQKKYGYLPGSAYIAFPARDLDYYLHAINLVSEFPDVVEAHMPQEWDADAQLRYVRQSRRMAA